MDAKLILMEMAKKNNLYGVGAKMYLNDKELGHQFLVECMEQIDSAPSGSSEVFGPKIVAQIKEYFKSYSNEY